MTSTRSAAPDAADELVLVYELDAPAELVYRSWLERDALAAWFAPDPFTVTRTEIDARAGGSWRVEYRAAGGESHAEYGRLVELEANRRLVLTLTQADGRGNAGPETIVTVLLEPLGERTRLRFSQTGLGSSQRRQLNGEGWAECFGKLRHYLDDAAAERELRALHEAWWRATEEKDLDATMAPISADVVSYEHEAPLQYKGVPAVREVCKNGLEATDGVVRWTVPDLQIVVRGDLAVAWGLNHMIGEGKNAFESWSRGTRVFRKLDGRWQMVHQHVSYPFDPATEKARFDLKP